MGIESVHLARQNGEKAKKILIFFSEHFFWIDSSSSFIFVPASVTARITPLSGMFSRVTLIPGGRNYQFLPTILITFQNLFPYIPPPAIRKIIEAQYQIYHICGTDHQFSIGVLKVCEDPFWYFWTTCNQMRDHFLHHWQCLYHWPARERIF